MAIEVCQPSSVWVFINYLTFAFFLLGTVSVTTYFLPVLFQWVSSEQDLKKKYQAKWALVTGTLEKLDGIGQSADSIKGGSSGIGLKIAEKCAKQGISVCIAALDDHLLKKSLETLKATYKNVEFRGVGVDLSSSEFMTKLGDATRDIEITLIFNNAGYIKPGFFHTSSVGSLLANYNVNATACLHITHHFLQLMVARGQRGLICFTSSASGFIPNPMSAIYGSTKAFVTSFAASLAPEIKELGIDVVVLHPSPVDTNFYQSSENSALSALRFFRKTATTPEHVVSELFKAPGRSIMVDQGYFSIVTKLILKILDWNLLANIMTHMIKTNGDYKAFKAEDEKKKKAKAL